MKKTLLTVTLFTIFLAGTVVAQATSGTARTTRYWDSCKPSCAWTDNAPVNSNNPHGTCTACNMTGGRETNAGARSLCPAWGQHNDANNYTGSATTCMGQVPWAVNDNLSYGFAASHTNATCGWCYELTFNSAGVSGKKMVIMISNIGEDVGGNQFDLMIPGGGVGVFPHGLPRQLSQNGVSNARLGPTHGGFRAECGNNATCVRNMCDAAFSTPALADMKAGCYWYVDWFNIADNPGATFTKVDCPAALVTAYKEGRPGNTGPQPTTYTITFNVNGGNALNPSTATTGTNGRLSNIPTPTRSGHTFNGWFTSASGGTAVNTNTVFTANTTIFAQWTATASTYTITFNPNNGTVTPTSATTGNDGRLTSLPTPTRSGHNFDGWFTAVTGGTAVNQSTVFTANTTIYARWTATGTATYTITYNVNNGTGTAPPTQTVNAGSSATLAAGTGLSRTGFTFGGWNTNAAGSGTNYNAGASFTPTANITLFARWIATTTAYTVTYNINSGTGTTPTAQTVNAGTSVTLASNGEFSRSGFTFGGWNTNTGGTGTNYNAGASFTPTASITLFARWVTAVTTTYTVSYDINFGTGSTPATQTVNAGNSVTIASGNGFSRSGFTFGGWNTSAAGSGTNYGAGVSFTPTENTTLFARWTAASGNRTDTTKVEAEDLTSPSLPMCIPDQNNPYCIGSNSDGVTNIGWINPDDRATYSVVVPRAGSYTMVFRIATGLDRSTFRVTVGTTPVGEISTDNTGSWDTYRMVTLDTDVYLNSGVNTIILDFQSAVNVDYFLLLGEAPVSVRPGAAAPANKAPRTNIAIRSGAGGFTAMLPSNHSYTSYRLVDLQGREIRRGKIGPQTTDLKFDRVKNSVLFLKLEGRNVSTVVRAVTY